MKAPQLAAVGAVAVLAGCGGSGNSSGDPVARAARASNAEPSFRFTFHATGPVGGANDGNGVHDARAKLTRISFPSVKLDLLTDSSHGLVVYMRQPLVAAFLHGKSWLKVDLGKARPANGVNVDSLVQQGEADPASLLGALARAHGSKELGERHYRTSVDAKDAVLAGTAGRLRDRLARALERAHVQRLDVEVWVGADGRVRRLRSTVPQLTGRRQPITFTEELSGWGDDVGVAVPPDSEVADGSSGKLG